MTPSGTTPSPRTGGSRTGGRRTVVRPPARGVPTLREERRLLREGHLLVAGMDEVGRGALAGPVTVGVVVVDLSVRTAPAGVKDSKLLAPAVRESLVPRVRRWALAHAVGHAEPDEIDRYGIIAALRLAGRRALATLPAIPSCVILDGSHDWLTPPAQPPALFDLELIGRESAPDVALGAEPSVVTMVKADLRCAAVAAASVLAKVERDAIMTARSADHPQYGWHENKGYSAPEHGAAIRAFGPCVQHRRSWSLPGQSPGTDGDAHDAAALTDGSQTDVDLAGVDLAGADLAGADLADVDLADVDLAAGGLADVTDGLPVP